MNASHEFSGSAPTRQPFVRRLPASPISILSVPLAMMVAVDGAWLSRLRAQSLRPIVRVTTVAGSGEPGSVDGVGTAAQFQAPNGVFVGPDGSIYIADGQGHRIRRILMPQARVLTYAGNGIPGCLDGCATNAQFNLPLGVFVGPANDLFVADSLNHVVRKIGPLACRTVATLAGPCGQPGFVDGVCRAARLDTPDPLTHGKKTPEGS